MNRDCCSTGCKPKENTCCSGGFSCDPGYKCCGDRNCAPEGGECCRGGRSCGKGLRCVVLNGIQGCCKDLSCSEFDEDIGGGTYGSETTESPTSVSEASVPLPSYTITPFSITPIAIPSLSSITFSFPSVTFPFVAPSISNADYRYYTTTITWYYYYFYISTFLRSSEPTSDYTSTTTTLSVYASARSQASSIFASLSADITFPSSVTAPGYSAAAPTATASAFSGEFTGASGARRKAERSWAVWLLVAVGLFSGMGMVLL